MKYSICTYEGRRTEIKAYTFPLNAGVNKKIRLAIFFVKRTERKHERKLKVTQSFINSELFLMMKPCNE